MGPGATDPPSTSAIDPAFAIEKLKIDLEKEKFFAGHKLERMKIIWISGVVALITVILTSGATITVSLIQKFSKDKEIALEHNKQQQSYLEQFVGHALNEDLQMRVDFANYVAKVATTEDMRALWKGYYSDLMTKISGLRAERASKLKQLNDLLISPNRDFEAILRLEEEIADLTRKLQGREIESRGRSSSESSLVYLVELSRVYVEAFASAREAGRLLYEAAGPAFEPEAGAKAGPGVEASTLFPETLGRRILDPNLRARIAAVDMVSTYTEVMMQLASGATAEEVRGGIGRFTQSALSLADLANEALPDGQIAKVAPGLTEIAERTRAESEPRPALLAGAELIDATLKELDADIDRLFAVERAYFQLRIKADAWFALANASRAALRFAIRHQYPADGALARDRLKLDTRFEALWQGVEGEKPAMLADVHGDSSAAPYDASAHETLTGLVLGLEYAAATYRARVEAWLNYQDALTEFGAMLASSRAALSASVAAATRPTPLSATVERLRAIAGEVNGHATNIIRMFRRA